MCNTKKIVALLIVVCLVVTIFPTVSLEKYVALEKVGEELLEVFGVSYDELLSGAYEENGERYSCIIWLKDVDVTEAVVAGIDVAEMTRDQGPPMLIHIQHMKQMV